MRQSTLGRRCFISKLRSSIVVQDGKIPLLSLGLAMYYWDSVRKNSQQTSSWVQLKSRMLTSPMERCITGTIQVKTLGPNLKEMMSLDVATSFRRSKFSLLTMDDSWVCLFQMSNFSQNLSIHPFAYKQSMKRF